jgi:putative peptide modification system cyclase
MPGSPDNDELIGTTAAAAELLLRTILILDLVDSTALVERLGDQRAAELFRRHDRLARDLMRRFRGREIDKTDGFLLLFERSVQAVEFALEYQRRLAELALLEGLPMAARIGIHVGEVVLWENSAEEVARGAKLMDVEGLAKPVAARLMSIALPGQILLSGMAYGLALRAGPELRAAGRTLAWKCHGRYRFKGVSGATPVFEVSEAQAAQFRLPPNTHLGQRILPWWQRPIVIIGESLTLLAVLLGLAHQGFKSEPGIPFAAHDWVVVGDFVNSTGQQALDDSLDVAFRQGLTESQHVNVIGSLQIRDAQTRMQLDPDSAAVDRAVGAELAQREAARALLLPSIADARGGFRIAVEVVDPQTQATVHVFSEFAKTSEDLLPAMDRLLKNVRENLGESLPAIKDSSLPLNRATTANLEALQVFSVGVKQDHRLRYDEARHLYERAVELDPEFALAYAGIASTYLPLGRFDEGLPAARKAASLRDRLSPREATRVQALLAFAEDPRAGVERWRNYASQYPYAGAGDFHAAIGLWQDFNQCPEALPLSEVAFNSRDPERFMSGHSKGYCQLWMGQANAAERSFNAAIQVNPLPFTLGLGDVYTYLERFDSADMALKVNPVDIPAQVRLEADARRVTWYAYQGRLTEGGRAAAALATAAAEGGVLATASRARLYAMALRLHSGEEIRDFAGLAEPELAVLESAQVSPYPVALHLALMALMAERRGEEALAREWLGRIRARMPARPNPSLNALLTILDARLAADPLQGLQLLAPGSDTHEYFQLRVAAADLAREAGRPELELEQLRWIDAQRGRAFAEFNGYFAAQVLNVLDVNRALLRQIQVTTDPEQHLTLVSRLNHRWKLADPELLAGIQRPAQPSSGRPGRPAL